jgi:hypothetical protein
VANSLLSLLRTKSPLEFLSCPPMLAANGLFMRASQLPSAKHTQFLFTGNTCFDPYPQTCLYIDGAHYICCDSKECGPIDKDGNTPLCRGSGITLSPNNYPPAGTPPSTPTPPSGNQGGKARKWAPHKALPSAQCAANWIQLGSFSEL